MAVYATHLAFRDLFFKSYQAGSLCAERPNILYLVISDMVNFQQPDIWRDTGPRSCDSSNIHV
jgi:hypothetical protein